jgi:hypothetical protein
MEAKISRIGAAAQALRPGAAACPCVCLCPGAGAGDWG